MVRPKIYTEEEIRERKNAYFRRWYRKQPRYRCRAAFKRFSKLLPAELKHLEVKVQELYLKLPRKDYNRTKDYLLAMLFYITFSSEPRTLKKELELSRLIKGKEFRHLRYSHRYYKEIRKCIQMTH